ncbi:Sec-independent protein translocase subunit TatA/TatB [Cohnella nanjingensis]|uniref:Twin-arginine translocase TatA/TatE family subunit n=1 Tax=Cohnella nanjingensis TaxID=1387779 RepID=A0A7X0RSN6_9BACL|nr:twin-arginine translocase TatA/TatE family subunit [Cohnella nanjingensis]MBB6672947.1 twin-arginine translocase TatA/TatE family subunit [Cohnella nanjingensis]
MGDLLAPWHILTLVVIGLLLFGPNKLPQLGHASGRMLREFRTALRGEDKTSDTEKPKELEG